MKILSTGVVSASGIICILYIDQLIECHCIDVHCMDVH